MGVNRDYMGRPMSPNVAPEYSQYTETMYTLARIYDAANQFLAQRELSRMQRFVRALMRPFRWLRRGR